MREQQLNLSKMEVMRDGGNESSHLGPRDLPNDGWGCGGFNDDAWVMQ
jgi:hypothetical protein